MTAIVLPDIDRSTLAELRERMPSLKLSEIDLPSLKLSEIDLPSLEQAGREADRAIDRVLGRSRPTIWPWVAAAAAIAAIAGTAFALLTWYRRPAWQSTGGSMETTPFETTPADDVASAPGAYQGIGGTTTLVDAVAVDTGGTDELAEGGPA
jgi:hypothetical protein